MTAAGSRKHPFKNGLDVRYLGVESYRDVLIHNWSREIRFRPEVIFFPKTAQEVVAIIHAAHRNDKRISIMGKGHSWNALMEGSDYLICTVDMNSVISVDPEQRLVTVEPGATIAEVNNVLARYGLSIPGNIVGTTDITFGGLMATGSHGSGAAWAPMSDLMVAVEMVQSNGEIKVFSDSASGKAVMDALRLNLGLFGVMSKITLKVEPTYNVEVVDASVPLLSLFDHLPDFLAGYETVEVLWFPFAENVTIKAWKKTNKPKRRASWVANSWAWVQRQFAYTIFETYISRKILRDPAATPRLMRRFSPFIFPPRTYITDITAAMHYVNEATMFPVKETEIALPFSGAHDLSNVRAAWHAMTDTVWKDASQGTYTLNIIAHMRFSAGSTAYMSPAYGNRLTAWVDFGSYYKTPGWEELVHKVWSLWRKIPGARLHWAKEMRKHEGLDLRAMYGAQSIDKFLELRAHFDPKGLFANDFTRRIFGLQFPDNRRPRLAEPQPEMG